MKPSDVLQEAHNILHDTYKRAVQVLQFYDVQSGKDAGDQLELIQNINTALGVIRDEMRLLKALEEQAEHLKSEEKPVEDWQMILPDAEERN